MQGVSAYYWRFGTSGCLHRLDGRPLTGLIYCFSVFGYIQEIQRESVSRGYSRCIQRGQAREGGVVVDLLRRVYRITYHLGIKHGQ